MVMDWIDALADFTLAEIQHACRDAVRQNPDRMPNEGHIQQRIIARRSEIRRAAEQNRPKEEPRRPVMTDAERKASGDAIVADFLRGKSMGGEA